MDGKRKIAILLKFYSEDELYLNDMLYNSESGIIKQNVQSSQSDCLKYRLGALFHAY